MSYTSTDLLWKTETRDRLADGQLPERWVSTESIYDGMGRVVRQVRPEVPDATTGLVGRPAADFIYGPFGRLEEILDSYGNSTSFGYDIRGNLSYRKGAKVRDAESGKLREPITRYFHDAAGRIAEVAGPLSQSWIAERDPAGRVRKLMGPLLISDEDPLGGRSTIQYEIDPRGDIGRIIDPRGNSVYFTYDSHSGLVEKRTPVSDAGVTSDVVESVVRDARGQVVRVEDGLGQATAFDYDGLGRQTSRVRDPDLSQARADTTFYDALLPVARIDAMQQRFDYEYDERFSVQALRVAGKPSEDLQYGYDDLGRLLSVDASNVPAGLGTPDVSYSYDILGRVESETSNGIVHTFGYDLEGRIARIAGSANSRVLTMRHDAAGRVIRLDDTSGAALRTTHFAYDIAGNLVRETMANGLVQSSAYDAMGRRVEQLLKTSSGEELGSVHCDYDAASNLREIREFGQLRQVSAYRWMAYDQLNRLVYDFGPAEGIEHRYDKAGNRVQTRVADYSGNVEIKKTFGYFGDAFGYQEEGNSNQLALTSEETFEDEVLVSERVRSYEYDANGNRRSEETSVDLAILGKDHYTYDSFGRLTQLEIGAGTGGENGIYRYAYDHDSRRIGRAAPGQPDRLFSFRGSSPAHEWTPGSGGGALPGLAENIGGGVGGRLYSYEGASPVYSFHNPRGDVILQTTDGGSLSYQAVHAAYGLAEEQFGSRAGGYGANSKWHEPAGLINDGYRYRDADTGTFISRDPAGFIDGLNDYGYVRNNPWSAFDPNGLATYATEIGYVNPPLGVTTAIDPVETGVSPITAGSSPPSTDDAGFEPEETWEWSNNADALDAFNRNLFRNLMMRRIQNEYDRLLSDHLTAISGGTPHIFDEAAFWSDAGYLMGDLGFVDVKLEYWAKYRAAVSDRRRSDIYEGLYLAAIDVLLLAVDGPLPIGDGLAAASTGSKAVGSINRVANPVPSTMARVIPNGVPATTLGRPGAVDVFVTAADDIAGMTAAQIADRLTISESPSGFQIFEFATPRTGVASPVLRTDPGFIGGGRTLGGAREFVIPNGPIPPDSTIRIAE